MSTSDLGTKQLCPNCEAKFYDLNKRPAVCPKCQNSFEPDAEEILAARTSAAAKATPKPEPADEDEDEGEEVKAAETDEDEGEEEDIAELGDENEATIAVGDGSEEEDDESGPAKGVPAGFSEQGVDDDDILDEDEAEEFDIDIDVDLPDDEDDLPGE